MLNLLNLESGNLLLRELKSTDIPKVHEYASDPDVVEYLDFGPNTLEETKEFVNMCIEYQNQKERVDYELGIINKSTNELIGACGIHISDKANREGWIGYVLKKSCWRKGYGTEVASILIDIGFNQFKLHRIYATCDPNNIGSQRVLEKNAMQKEGYLRQNLYVRGGWRDSLIYAILEDEFMHMEDKK